MTDYHIQNGVLFVEKHGNCAYNQNFIICPIQSWPAFEDPNPENIDFVGFDCNPTKDKSKAVLINVSVNSDLCLNISFNDHLHLCSVKNDTESGFADYAACIEWCFNKAKEAFK